MYESIVIVLVDYKCSIYVGNYYLTKRYLIGAYGISGSQRLGKRKIAFQGEAMTWDILRYMKQHNISGEHQVVHTYSTLIYFHKTKQVLIFGM